VIRKPGTAISAALVVFALFSLAIGFLQMPPLMAPVTVFSDFLSRSMPAAASAPVSRVTEVVLFLSAMIVPVAGVAAAWWLCLRAPGLAAHIAQRRACAALHRLLLAGWGFDTLYDSLFVRPFVSAARLNRDDFVDLVYGGLAWCSAQLSGRLVETQSGMIRRYAVGVLLGTVVALGLTLLFKELP
jgi:NADH-quinone oxidoreductase subunit L